MPSLTWKPAHTPPALHAALSTLASEYPLRATTAAPGAATLQVESTAGAPDACVVTRQGTVLRLAGGSLAAQLRAVGSALSGLLPEGASVTVRCPFARLGIMLDCSRNAVMHVPQVQQWLRRLALLGYNQVMLYTEDTYEIPGEPRFGYQRGRYTLAELRTLDDYAATLGITLVGCIQTLAHLEQILRWGEYQAIKDYESTLLVGEPKTYELIGKMLDAVGGAIRSRRIHIGMDEAWALGRGAYLDRHGGRRKFDIFNEHLAQVVKLCTERGLEPMIWSDMYFAMGSPSHGYYDTRCAIPPEVVAAIPKEVQLVYWDYYHADAAFYRDWIARHRAMGYEPPMASGVWTWGQLWYNHQATEANAGACLDACCSEGLAEVFFTMWGDDGAYCDFDSALAGLTWTAERAYEAGEPAAAALAARYRAICGGDYAAVHRAGDLNNYCGAALFWDDPLLGIFANEGLPPSAFPAWSAIQAHFAQLAADLAGRNCAVAAGDLEHARLLADTLARKMALRADLVAAYDARDRAALARVSAAATALASAFEALAESWRRGWMRRNKPQGFEVLQMRLAQQAARHREVARRVDEWLSGTITSIPELDERPLGTPQGMGGGWRFLASGSTSV